MISEENLEDAADRDTWQRRDGRHLAVLPLAVPW